MQAQRRSMLLSLTSSKHTSVYFAHSMWEQTSPQVLCVITDSLPLSSHPLAPSHCSAPFLTLLHVHIHTLTTTGVIRKPSRDQFFPHSLLFFSPSACSVSLCWLLSRHSGTLACQRDIDWEGEGAEVLLERLSAHKRLCVFVHMWKCLCVCLCVCERRAGGNWKEKQVE